MTERIRPALTGLVLLSVTIATGCAPPPPPPAPAVIRTGPPPWPAPRDAISYLDRLGMERLPLRYQPAHAFTFRLRVRVAGQAVQVPKSLGMDLVRGVQAPLHTHAADGVVFVEPRRPATFTLGQLFDLWGVRLTRDCLGGGCAGGGRRLVVAVDGRPVTTDPRALPLAADRTVTVELSTG